MFPQRVYTSTVTLFSLVPLKIQGRYFNFVNVKKAISTRNQWNARQKIEKIGHASRYRFN